MTWQVTKRYDIGLSCAFRQHKAASHCRFNHGYALIFEFTFESGELNEQDWVTNFGGLQWIKDYLVKTYDHKTVIAKDDPALDTFIGLAHGGILDIWIVEHVSCERFAEAAFKYVKSRFVDANAKLLSVKVSEHDGNSALYYE